MKSAVCSCDHCQYSRALRDHGGDARRFSWDSWNTAHKVSTPAPKAAKPTAPPAAPKPVVPPKPTLKPKAAPAPKAAPKPVAPTPPSTGAMAAARVVISAMGADEKAALMKGYAAAKTAGSTGSLEDYLVGQHELYKSAPEGDPRLTTYLSGDTMSRMKANGFSERGVAMSWDKWNAAHKGTGTTPGANTAAPPAPAPAAKPTTPEATQNPIGREITVEKKNVRATPGHMSILGASGQRHEFQQQKDGSWLHQGSNARATRAVGGMLDRMVATGWHMSATRMDDWLPGKEYKKMQTGLKKAKALRKKSDAAAKPFGETPSKTSPSHPINPLKVKAPKGSSQAPGKTIGAIHAAPSAPAAAPAAAMSARAMGGPGSGPHPHIGAYANWAVSTGGKGAPIKTSKTHPFSVQSSHEPGIHSVNATHAEAKADASAKSNGDGRDYYVVDRRTGKKLD